VSRRSLPALLAAMMTAVMIGIRDSTGLAPPPPLLPVEEIHWLSPELEGDPEIETSISLSRKVG